MSFDADRFWSLIPAHLRERDTELANPTGPDAAGRWKPGPLRQLIGVLAGQATVLEEDLEQLYDNHFVETAAPWALPYLGDLLGIRGLPAGNLAHTPRAEVGHTVAYRRRKGTAAMLELLARDVTGWPARAVEFFERLAATQNLNHLRPDCRSFASVRNAQALELMSSPFEPTMRTVEVRRIAPRRGKWNIPNLGLFVWRLRAYRLTQSPLAPARRGATGEYRRRKFRLHPLNVDVPVFTRPLTETDPAELAGLLNLPLPLSRRRLEADLRRPEGTGAIYGAEASLLLERYVDGAYRPVPATDILVCDLGGDGVWDHQDRAEGRQVAVDPARGRVVFGENQPATHPPRATLHLGFSADLGGGEYARPGAVLTGLVGDGAIPTVREVVSAPGPGQYRSVEAASQGGPAFPLAPEAKVQLVVKDSGRFEESLNALDAGDGQLELRAADGVSPTLILGPITSTTPVDLIGAPDASIVWDGLRVGGRPLRTAGTLGRLTLLHCLLTSPWDFASGEPIRRAGVPFALRIEGGTEVLIENSILGGLSAAAGARVVLRNCIVDAGDPEGMALQDDHAAGGAATAGPAIWRLENCTVRGRVDIGRLTLATNSIFDTDDVVVERRQEGCVRFCWLPAGARVPRRYRCLSDATDPGLRPHFTSTRLGDPAYGQLSRVCPEAIRTGADDGSELGGFHDLFQPQREAHLMARLAEYLPFGLEAGVFPAS